MPLPRIYLVIRHLVSAVGLVSVSASWRRFSSQSSRVQSYDSINLFPPRENAGRFTRQCLFIWVCARTKFSAMRRDEQGKNKSRLARERRLILFVLERSRLVAKSSRRSAYMRSLSLRLDPKSRECARRTRYFLSLARGGTTHLSTTVERELTLNWIACKWWLREENLIWP